jgi:hypothetical protein
MNLKSLVIPAILLFFISCKKTNTPPPVTQAATYLTISAGSSWTFRQIDSSVTVPATVNYTLTSSSQDTTINNKSYHIYNKSTGGFQYLNVTGNDYYQFDSLPSGFGAGVFERLYLKDNAAAGTTWTQNQTVNITNVPFPIPVTLNYNIAEKGITMIINSITYTNVIHVSTTLTSSLIPGSGLTSNINGYYAEKYGLIQSSTKINLNYMGLIQNVNLFVQLTSSTLL